MSMRRLVVLLVSLCLVATALPAEAATKARGLRARGALEGSGSSTLDGIGGHPVIRSVSEGTLDGKGVLRQATYRLEVSDTGTRRYVTLTIATGRGTIRAGGGPFIPSTLDTPLTIDEGTGRFANATGTLTLEGYARTDVVCVPPFPGAPAIFCDWDETAKLEGRVKLR